MREPNAARGWARTSALARLRGPSPFAVACTFAALLLNARAGAQAPAAPALPASAEQQPIDRAKALFREGVALYQLEDYESALDRYLRSRREYPSGRNTMNTALCLDKLKRFDEALEMYEEVTAKFASELDAENKTAVASAIATLRGRVANLEVSANVNGTLLIDGRPRGRLPLTVPVRLLPGPHKLRVVQGGYATFEAMVEVKAGATSTVDARLVPLTIAGGLRVEDPTNLEADILVDGAVIGTSPWEGTLTPGYHLIQSRKAERGSRPIRVMVVQGQTALVRLRSEQLGPLARFEVDPVTAELTLEGMVLGKGRWEGVLPMGSYRVAASEPGYQAADSVLSVGPPEGSPRTVHLTLQVDPTHPRWPRRPTGHVWAGAMLGLGIGPGLRSGPEQDCPGRCSSDPPVSGLLAGARGGYEFPGHLSIEVTAAYLWFAKDLARQRQTQFQAGRADQLVTYVFDDSLRFRAVMVGAGASLAAPISSDWWLRSRVTVGVLFARVHDSVRGTASGTTDQVPAGIVGAGGEVNSTPPFVMPELVVERRWGSWSAAAGLGVLFVPGAAPAFPHGDVVVDPGECSPQKPAAVACAPIYGGISGEQSFGPMLVWLPQLQVAHEF